MGRVVIAIAALMAIAAREWRDGVVSVFGVSEVRRGAREEGGDCIAVAYFHCSVGWSADGRWTRELH